MGMMPDVARYQVLDWDNHFENNKSRERDSCSFVCTPNKQHGMGLTYILSLPDGASIYGIWCLVVGALSQQRRPRMGWLTDDGKATGRPWTGAALARRWRRSDKEIGRALQVLTSDEVGWMRSECAEQVPAECPPDAPEGKGREGIEEKGKKGTDSSEPDVPASEPLLTFPVVGRGAKTWDFTEECRAELSSAYPDVDVLAESRKALAWVQANTSRRKTAVGMRKFLTGWMNRTNDRRGGIGAAGNGHFQPPAADELDPRDAAMIEDRYRERLTK